MQNTLKTDPDVRQLEAGTSLAHNLQSFKNPITENILHISTEIKDGDKHHNLIEKEALCLQSN